MPRPRTNSPRWRGLARSAVPIAILVASALDVAVAFAQATSTTHAQLPASTATINPTLTVIASCLNKKPVIDITWDAPAEVLNYALLKSSDNNAPKGFKTFTDGTTTYHDTAVTLNKTFTYRVTSTFHNWTGTSTIVGALTPKQC